MAAWLSGNGVAHIN